jgi:hypothetical protein
MSAWGQILPPRNVRGMSVMPPKAAVNAHIFVGRFVPIGDVALVYYLI